ncbi:MAG: hypothetical protein UV05_C0005G0004 [candidate division CPR1 bacterium GW2011_GWA2_42_17]|uniref:Gcp-like domain-containing protein n=1 Tax=candidate division CPR1 bacterium GW2011_GWA2_42_17 TaxID=1618341 RepID=A0A0G0Z714_9BACT|nr:MAG: hypothetical protein UV05_C0005G0004 [candidate division CPR1 bacterium GW2011_GWA2_42_17]
MTTKTQNSKLRTQNFTLIGLDSRDPQNTRVFFYNGKKWAIKKISLKPATAGSQLLACVEQFLIRTIYASVQNSRTRILHTNKLRLAIVIGLGARFSSLRLGVIIANALSLAKNLPLYGATLPADEFNIDKIKTSLLKAFKTKSGLQKPHYVAAPNITIQAF